MEEPLGKIFLLPSHNHNTLIQPNVKGIVFACRLSVSKAPKVNQVPKMPKVEKNDRDGDEAERMPGDGDFRGCAQIKTLN